MIMVKSKASIALETVKLWHKDAQCVEHVMEKMLVEMGAVRHIGIDVIAYRLQNHEDEYISCGKRNANLLSRLTSHLYITKRQFMIFLSTFTPHVSHILPRHFPITNHEAIEQRSSLALLKGHVVLVTFIPPMFEICVFFVFLETSSICKPPALYAVRTLPGQRE